MILNRHEHNQFRTLRELMDEARELAGLNDEKILVWTLTSAPGLIPENLRQLERSLAILDKMSLKAMPTMFVLGPVGKLSDKAEGSLLKDYLDVLEAALRPFLIYLFEEDFSIEQL